jgi:hypothetical protein
MSKISDRLREVKRADLNSISEYARGWNAAVYRTREDMREAADLLDEAEKALAEIAESDDIENALDPERNKRIARATLARIRGEQP